MKNNWINQLTKRGLYIVTIITFLHGVDEAECFSSSSTTNAAVTTTAQVQTTTLNPQLSLIHGYTLHTLFVVILIGIPLTIVVCCGALAFRKYRKETKISEGADVEKEETFQHPPPSLSQSCGSGLSKEPTSQPRREGTIMGPFGNQAFNDSDNDDDDAEATGRKDVVSPSFIDPRVSGGFDGTFNTQRRFQYIPN